MQLVWISSLLRVRGSCLVFQTGFATHFHAEQTRYDGSLVPASDPFLEQPKQDSPLICLVIAVSVLINEIQRERGSRNQITSVL